MAVAQRPARCQTRAMQQQGGGQHARQGLPGAVAARQLMAVGCAMEHGEHPHAQRGHQAWHAQARYDEQARDQQRRGNHGLHRRQCHALQAQHGARQQHGRKAHGAPQQFASATARRQGAPQAHGHHGGQVVQAEPRVGQAAQKPAVDVGFSACMGAGAGSDCAGSYQKNSGFVAV